MSAGFPEGQEQVSLTEEMKQDHVFVPEDEMLPDDERRYEAIAIVGTAALFSVLAATALVHELVFDKEYVPPESALSFYDADGDGRGINTAGCGQLLELYEPRTEKERDIMLGGAVTFTGNQPSQALQTAEEFQLPMVAHECQELVRSTQRDNLSDKPREFMTAVQPVDSVAGTFKIVVTLGAEQPA
jgi:hypothetical protein